MTLSLRGDGPPQRTTLWQRVVPSGFSSSRKLQRETGLDKAPTLHSKQWRGTYSVTVDVVVQRRSPRNWSPSKRLPSPIVARVEEANRLELT